MTSQMVQIKKYLEKEYSDFKPASLPDWWGSTKWNPSLFWRSKKRQKYLAVDIELSGRLPVSIFKESVLPLKQQRGELVVVVCLTERGLSDFPETEDECRDMGLGLKVLEPGLGLTTLVATDLEPQKSVPVAEEVGYFPTVILDRAEGLEKLMFRRTVDSFVAKIRRIQAECADKVEEKTRKLVLSTIDDLLKYHPSFKGTISEFMRLDHFEELFLAKSPGSTEHVLHAFRVFLAGCPVVNQFYDDFRRAHRRYSDGCRLVRVEYAWLLSSIFHDIGRVKEGAKTYGRILQEELQDDDLTVHVDVNPTPWGTKGYRDALRVLTSLAAYLGHSARGDWDGGGLCDADGEALEIEWIRSYGEFRHGVISAIDFLRLVCDNARAADERKARPFLLAHAVPAALAILLHDWKIHPEAEEWGLFPIDTKRFPLASLLYYVDTWDDYKRKGDKSDVSIAEYRIRPKEAKVRVEWGDETLFRKEQVKYDAFAKGLRNEVFRMLIDARMAGS